MSTILQFRDGVEKLGSMVRAGRLVTTPQAEVTFTWVDSTGALRAESFEFAGPITPPEPPP